MKKAVNAIITILVAIPIISCIARIFTATGAVSMLIFDIALAISGISILYYTYAGYKKPHGNAFRYTMFFFACVTVFETLVDPIAFVGNIFIAAAGIIIAYMSGRLDKIKENRSLIITVTVFFIIGSLVADYYSRTSAANFLISGTMYKVLTSIRNYTLILEWFALALAYTNSFIEHKDAGEVANS